MPSWCRVMLLLLAMGPASCYRPATISDPAVVDLRLNFSRAGQVALEDKIESVQTVVANCTACPTPAAVEDAGDCADPRLAYQQCTASQPGDDVCCPPGWHCDSTNSLCMPGLPGPFSYPVPPSPSGKRVGIMVSGWHQPALHEAPAGGPLTVEAVLRSRQEDLGGTEQGAHELTDAVTATYYWHSTPQAGFYCIVHARAEGDLHYNPQHEGAYLDRTDVPDCAGYQDTLRRHAQQLTAAGVDFVVLDATNLVQYDAYADAIQLRPLEVILEEWAALRAQGTPTPDVATWQRFPYDLGPGARDRATDLYTYALDLYNAPQFDSLIFRNGDGKKVLFYPDLQDFDVAYIADAEANNGLGGVVAVPMWVNRQDAGSWSFMAYCSSPPFLSDQPCDQQATQGATGTGGSQLAISPSYQLTYGSLPFRSPGTLGGLTMRKQFETAFAMQPDYLFISAWNERIAMALPPQGDPGQSMGLEDDPTASGLAFVDMHASAFSRDIEPTEEYGTLLYDLLTSCLRVFRSGTPACSDATEACCQGGAFSDNFAYYMPQGAADYTRTFGMSVKPLDGFVPLYECPQGLSGTACGNSPLGYVAPQKGGNYLRPLRTCQDGSYTLLHDCPAVALLGYVI